MQAVIFANGVLTPSSFVHRAVHSADLLIAANGGALNARLVDAVPQVVIGDMDSLEDEDLAALRAAGTELIQHPARKEHTDLELALQYAIQAGAGEILVLAALGARWDQTLANLLMPAGESYLGVKISLVDGQQEINLLKQGTTLVLRGRPGDTVSLIPLWGDAHGITTQGLEYPLENESLIFGSTRGISNALIQQQASVYLEQGLLVSVLIHADDAVQE